MRCEKRDPRARAEAQVALATVAEQEVERVPGQPKHCVHPWSFVYSGRCENCQLSPLSPNLPDHHARKLLEGDEDGF
jgi:hypothetical protein